VVAGGAVVGGLLSGGALGATGGALEAGFWKEDFGISEQFVDEVGRLIEPGDSAIFVLARSADPDLMAERLRGYGGTVLRSSLTQEQAAKVQALLQSSR
jgi:uncharacterized membrane protein